MILTNRPNISKAHKLGHIAMHFYSPETPVISVTLDGTPISYSNASSSGNNIYVLHIPRSTYSGAKKVQVTINGETKTINVVKRACKAYTIAWLNPIGGIDHYTFYTDKEESNDVTKEKILTNNGYKLIASDYDHNIIAYSDYENNDMLNWISEIYSSPKTWLLEGDNITPIDILSSDLVTYSSDLTTVQIEFRLSKPVRLQRL